jgi:hypothetical protein
MPKLPTLAVYANPWHGPLDHNHRACSAVPWDPSDNPQRVHVGAAHRMVGSGEQAEIYFEYSQYEGTDGVALTLRKGHEGITLPATRYFLEAIRNGSLWPADEKTHKLAFGNLAHYRPVADRAKEAPGHALDGHKYRTGEDAEPSPRPAVGEGGLGPQHAHRLLSSVNTVHAAAQEELRLALAESAKKQTDEVEKTRLVLADERAKHDAADAAPAPTRIALTADAHPDDTAHEGGHQ